MYPAESKELFHQKRCKFTRAGADQTPRRPLAVLLSEIAAKETTYPKTQGNFKKQNFDARGNIPYCIAVTALFRAANPQGWYAQR